MSMTVLSSPALMIIYMNIQFGQKTITNKQMKSEILHNKLERYLCGQSLPAEESQIQNWLSCTASETKLTPEERSLLELEILQEIQAYTAYPLFYPKRDKPWWQKITALF